MVGDGNPHGEIEEIQRRTYRPHSSHPGDQAVNLPRPNPANKKPASLKREPRGLGFNRRWVGY